MNDEVKKVLEEYNKGALDKSSDLNELINDAKKALAEQLKDVLNDSIDKLSAIDYYKVSYPRFFFFAKNSKIFRKFFLSENSAFFRKILFYEKSSIFGKM